MEMAGGSTQRPASFGHSTNPGKVVEGEVLGGKLRTGRGQEAAESGLEWVGLGSKSYS